MNNKSSTGIVEYDAHDIYFIYPENWALEELEMDSADGAIQLTSQAGAFWLLKKYPFGTNPDEIAREAIEAMQGEYKDMEIDRVERLMHDKSVTGYEITFFYLDLMNLATVWCFEWNGLTYAIFWQTGNQLIIQSNDEAVPAEKVLEAITLSLLRGKPSTQE